jgi:hypothetical protein
MDLYVLGENFGSFLLWYHFFTIWPVEFVILVGCFKISMAGPSRGSRCGLKISQLKRFAIFPISLIIDQEDEKKISRRCLSMHAAFLAENWDRFHLILEYCRLVLETFH